MKIACISNEKYLPILKTFLYSIQENTSFKNIVVLLINSHKPAWLDSLDLNIEYILEQKQLCTKRNKLSKDGVAINETFFEGLKKNKSTIKSPPKWLYSDEMAYCSNSRFKLINKILKSNESVLFCDVDTIFRKKCVVLEELVDHYDITTRVERDIIKPTGILPERPITEPDNTLYHMGLIGAKPSDLCITMFDNIIDDVNKDLFDWDADHICFYNNFNKYKPTLHELDTVFKDEGPVYNDASNIWSGAGNRKFTNVQYINECAKYQH